MPYFPTELQREISDGHVEEWKFGMEERVRGIGEVGLDQRMRDQGRKREYGKGEPCLATAW